MLNKFLTRVGNIIKGKRSFTILFPLYLIITTFRTIPAISFLSNIAPVISVLLIFFLYPLVNKNKFLGQALYFLKLYNLWVIVTCLWSVYPLVSLSRGILQLVISNGAILGACYYGLITAETNNEKRGDILKYLLPLNLFLIAAGLFSFITHIPSDYWSGYGYGLKGFFGHQNTYASLLVFSFPAVLWKTGKSLKQNFAWLILVFLNIFLLILTHSRASITVLIIAVVIWAFLILNKKILLSMLAFFSLIIVLFVINPSLRSGFNTYFYKTETNILDRKKPVILGSVDAAKDGKLIGLGFGVSNPRVVLDSRYFWHYEGSRMVREKSVSVLALIEETGFIGLLLFLLFIAVAFWFLFKNKENKSTSYYIMAFLIAMSIHAQLESWWVGVTASQLLIFYALIGSGLSLKKEEDENSLPF